MQEISSKDLHVEEINLKSDEFKYNSNDGFR